MILWFVGARHASPVIAPGFQLLKDLLCTIIITIITTTIILTSLLNLRAILPCASRSFAIAIFLSGRLLWGLVVRWVQGKTALVRVLCEALRDRFSLGVVTNDIFTREDAEFLLRHEALEADRIIGVETGGCPHAAIREDISLNLNALEDLMIRFECDIDLLFVESGGDNLAAHFSKELVDYAIYVIDVSAGDKIPRKGGPGITQSDLLVINKTDLAGLIGADLGVMAQDAKKMRGDGPTLFACLKHRSGLDEIIEHVLRARRSVLSPP